MTGRLWDQWPLIQATTRRRIDGATKGIRCAAKEGTWWCTRDAGHYGAHEARDNEGRGLIAWWNEEYLR